MQNYEKVSLPSDIALENHCLEWEQVKAHYSIEILNYDRGSWTSKWVTTKTVNSSFWIAISEM